MKKALLTIVMFYGFVLFAQSDSTFVLPLFSDSTKEIPLDKYWKFNPGDDKLWALPATNDSLWIPAQTNLNVDDLAELKFSGIGWFRLHLMVPEGMQNKPLALLLSQKGASEFYLDGKLMHSFGIPGTEKTGEKKFTPNNKPFIIAFKSPGNYLLAVRYSNQTYSEMSDSYSITGAGFNVEIAEANSTVSKVIEDMFAATIVLIFLFTFFITLSFVHFLLFLFHRAQRVNLYYSIFIFLFGLFFLIPLVIENTTNPDSQIIISFYYLILVPIFFTSLLGFIYSLFYPKIPVKFWIICLVLLLILILKFLRLDPPMLFFGYVFTVTIISTVQVIIAFVKKKKGAWALGLSAMCFLLLILTMLFKDALGFGAGFEVQGSGAKELLLIGLIFFALLGIPISMSIYLARDFAKTSKTLSKKLIEVEELSAKSLEQEKEKQKILSSQNHLLEEQVKERTSEISEQKNIIEEKNKDITDSINYAKRIQDAMLPEQDLLNKIFKDAFVLFKPKDIVSGDFYWFAEHDGKKIVALADCTGHGVPGALMSMIGSNILNKLVLEKGITQPDLILNELNDEVQKALRQKEEGSETRDGMDIAIICIQDSQLQYAGAHRPLYLISNNELNEIKADKFSIGGIQREEKRIFSNHVVDLQKSDVIYFSSDGYADQFGGENGKKLMTKNFKEFLLKIYNDPMKMQQEFLDKTIENWKGIREQIDDILVIGIRHS